METSIRVGQGAGHDRCLLNRRSFLGAAVALVGCGGRSVRDGDEMRSVETELFQVPLSTGMNESTDPRSAAPGTLYAVRNCRLRTGGSLQKRCGTTAVTGTTTTPPNAKALVSFTQRPAGEHPMFIGMIDSEISLVGTDAGDAFRYSDETGQWKYHGSFSTASPQSATTPIPSADFPSSSIGTLGGVRPACAMNAAGYTCFAVGFTDRTVRIVVQGPDGTQIASESIGPLVGNIVKVQVINTNVNHGATVTDGFVVLFDGAGGGGNEINGYEVEIFQGVATIRSSFSGVVVTGPDWDAARYTAALWLLVYRIPAGGVTRIATATTATGSTITDVATNATVADSVSVYGDTVNARIWLGYISAAGDARAAVYQIGGTLDLDFVIQATVTGASPPLFGPAYGVVQPPPTSVVYAFSATIASAFGSTPSARYTYYGTTTIGGANNAYGTIAHAIPISKPYGRHEMWIATALSAADTLTPSRYVLVRMQDIGETTDGLVTPLQLASPEQIGNVYAVDATTGGLAVATDGNGNFAMALGVAVTSQTAAGGTTVQEPLMQGQLFRYSFGGYRATVDIGEGMLLTGQPTVASRISRRSHWPNSAGMVENGFAHGPAIFSVTASNVGSGGISAGSYSYVAVAWWVDEFGQLQQSTPSEPETIALTLASDVVIVVARPYGLGCRVSPDASIKLYRTTDGGENYQLVPEAGDVEAANPGLIIFTDNQTDATLANESFVYTDGSVLPNVLAPSCRFSVMAEDRLWCGGLWDPTMLEASKVRVPGEPLNFTGDASHQVALPEACTGLAYMDGQVVAFADSAIYLVGGDGPNDQGAGSFLPPRLLTRAVGCISYRSVLETKIGILFQSSQGVYLLPRGFGAPQYVGQSVQDTLLTYPTILAAAATESSEFSLARFLVAAEGETGTGRVLTFDIDSGAWFVDIYAASSPGFSVVGQGTDGAAFCYYDLTADLATTPSPVWYEDETIFYDDGATGTDFIARYIETAWIQPFGIGGWGRANKILMTTSSDYGGTAETQQVSLTLEVDTDGNVVAPPWNVESLGWNVPATGEQMSYRGFDIKQRECTMMRGIITESSANPGNSDADHARGPKFLGLTFEIMNQNGMRMLTDSERS